MAEVVQHNKEKFVRINPADIDLSAMTQVHRVTEVIAAQVSKGRIKVITRHNKTIETINYVNEGDFLVYETGAVKAAGIADALIRAERKAISKTNFRYLYVEIDGIPVGLSAAEILRVTQELLLDNQDNKDFNTGFLHNLKKYRYIGKAIYAANVPFNFVIKAPWGSDQFVRRGGMIVYDTNVSNDPELYGIDGERYRVAGEFEKIFAIADVAPKIIADSFKMALKADRDEIEGIKFKDRDVAKAYGKAGKRMPAFLKKFLD